MKDDKNTHLGHRQRMRKKLETSSLIDLPEHESLEIILFSVMPRGDTNSIAHSLLNKYGTIYGVLTATIESLTEVEGVGTRTAEFLHNLPSVLGVVLKSKLDYVNNKRKLDFKNLDIIRQYLTAIYADAPAERAVVLYLDKNFNLINYEKLTEGTANTVYVDIPNIVRLSVINRAVHIVMSHNHFSGNPRPSSEDVRMTRRLREALSSVDIDLWDHVIISGERYYSFRESENGYNDI